MGPELRKQGNIPALHPEETAQAPGATRPCLQFRGQPAGGAVQLGGAGGNNGRSGRPPCFLFRCQEEPCRCRLGPSGLPRFSIARFSGLSAATVPRLGLGSCRVSPLGCLRWGARLAGDDAKTRGPWGPGGSRAFDGEGPPGTRRPRDLVSHPSGSGVPTSCQTWTGVGRERATLGGWFAPVDPGFPLFP